MYLNLNLIHEKKYTLPEVYLMQLLKQARTEEMETYLAMYFTDEIYDKFVKEGILDFVKKKKKSDSDFKIMRLSKKGSNLLEDFYTPLITEGDSQMFDYLCEMYLSHEDEDRVIGNKKKTKMYCCIFRNRLSITLHQMYWLCWLFLQEFHYTKKLENIFFDSNKNRYGTFEGNFEDSPLFQFWDENKTKVIKLWKSKGCLKN